jgi:OHCU decarboxylase
MSFPCDGMSDGLDRLNDLPRSLAEDELLACGGALSWAREMAARRPFRDQNHLLQVADQVWRSLDRDDWLEAFGRHPRIGERKTGSTAPKGTQISTQWSTEEQSRVQDASTEARVRLAEANRLYEERFGYIFIVLATGKTAEDMLALLELRLHNDPSAELLIAAEEQRLIMLLRVKKLLATLQV